MNILFISQSGSFLGLSSRVRSEGYTSYLYLPSPSSLGDGIISKPSFSKPLTRPTGEVISSNIETLLKETNPSLVVFDGRGFGTVADYLSKKSIPVLGSCRWADEASTNLLYSSQLLKSVGVLTPSLRFFSGTQYDDALTFLSSSEGKAKRYTLSFLSSPSTIPTYTVSANDGLAMLNTYLPSGCEFLLQEYPRGVEVNCEFWWNGLSSHIHNIVFVDDRLMTGNVGLSIGYAGTVVRTVAKGSLLIREGIAKLERLLKKTNYRGPLTLHCILTSSSLYAKSLTVAFTPSLFPLLELLRGNITSLLWEVARGGSDFGVFTFDYSSSVCLSIPPYPYSLNHSLSLPLLGVDAGNEKHIWWEDVLRTNDGYRTAATSGKLLYATARGPHLSTSLQRVYRTLSSLIIPNKQYRLDIGETAGKSESRLKADSWI
jgi:hypothetical protein